jgi:hypothetical protein
MQVVRIWRAPFEPLAVDVAKNPAQPDGVFQPANSTGQRNTF